MAYKFELVGANTRNIDGVPDSVVILINCENTDTKSSVPADIVVSKTEFTKWPPPQSEIEIKAKAYLNAKNGAVTFADEMKERVKTIVDTQMNIAKAELDLATVVPK
jgi:hypothetical protein